MRISDDLNERINDISRRFAVAGINVPPDKIKRALSCPRCHGLGYIWQGKETEDCPVCNGKGVVAK